MKASLAAAIGILLLLLAVFLFLFSSVIAASDAQGAILFLFTLPLMLALLSLAALLTRSRSRPVFYLNVFATIFLLLFISAAIFPGLRFIGEATIGGISRIYKNLFGLSPYQAHHGAKLDLPTLFEKSIEAQGGDLLDLRKMEIFSSWNRVCLFDSRTDDQREIGRAHV